MTVRLPQYPFECLLYKPAACMPLELPQKLKAVTASLELESANQAILVLPPALQSLAVCRHSQFVYSHLSSLLKLELLLFVNEHIGNGQGFAFDFVIYF